MIKKGERISSEKKPPWKGDYNAKGFCISCKNVIDFDPETKNTHCRNCITLKKENWSKFTKESGNYCHFCGDIAEYSPFCKPCWYKFCAIRDYHKFYK